MSIRSRVLLAMMASAALGACELDLTTSDELAVHAPRLERVAAPVAHSYLVVLDADETPSIADTGARIATLAETYGAQVERAFPGLQMFEATLPEVDAWQLAADGRVAYVQENGHKHALASAYGATWGLDRIDQRDRPLDAVYRWDRAGEGVTAYILDTGIRITHADLGGRAVHGFSSIDDGRGDDDCHGHGTHVAGTVGSATYGVARSVTLKAVRVLNCQGSGSDAEVIAGIEYVRADRSGPSVANMSLGEDAAPALDEAVQRATAAGVVFAIAAGNENRSACLVSPARTPEAITVGATAIGDDRNLVSNWGPCLDLFAPGTGITSLWNTSDTATSTITGTSMASPHVAGAAALLLAADPGLSPAEVRDALVDGATSGKVVGPGNGSPNKLLFTGGGPPDTEPGPGTPHQDTYSGTALFFGWMHQAPITVRPGSRLTVALQNTGGNADLYVRFGSRPTTSAYDCRPAVAGGAEACILTVPAGATTAYVSVRDAGFLSTFSGTRRWVSP